MLRDEHFEALATLLVWRCFDKLSMTSLNGKLETMSS